MRIQRMTIPVGPDPPRDWPRWSGWAIADCRQGRPGDSEGADQPGPVDRREGIRWPGEGGKRIKVSHRHRPGRLRPDQPPRGVVRHGRIPRHLVGRPRPWSSKAGAEARGQGPSVSPRPGLGAGPGVRQRRRAGDIGEREGDLSVDDKPVKVSRRIRFSHRFQLAAGPEAIPVRRPDAHDRQVSPFDPYAHDLDLVDDQSRVAPEFSLEGASVADREIGRIETRPRSSDARPPRRTSAIPSS